MKVGDGDTGKSNSAFFFGSALANSSEPQQNWLP